MISKSLPYVRAKETWWHSEFPGGILGTLLQKLDSWRTWEMKNGGGGLCDPFILEGISGKLIRKADV